MQNRRNQADAWPYHDDPMLIRQYATFPRKISSPTSQRCRDHCCFEGAEDGSQGSVSTRWGPSPVASQWRAWHSLFLLIGDRKPHPFIGSEYFSSPLSGNTNDFYTKEEQMLITLHFKSPFSLKGHWMCRESKGYAFEKSPQSEQYSPIRNKGRGVRSCETILSRFLALCCRTIC